MACLACRDCLTGEASVVGDGESAGCASGERPVWIGVRRSVDTRNTVSRSWDQRLGSVSQAGEGNTSMEAASTRATIVVCGTVPALTGQRGEWPRLDQSPVPVTWIAAWDSLAALAAAGRQSGLSLALDIPAGALDSRQRLRTLLARGRDALSLLDAVSVHGKLDRSHRDLLVDEGVRAVIVDRLAADCRGSRRPAPRGWRCRNTAWGLWEVETAEPVARGWRRWLGQGRPRVRPGGLHAITTEGLMLGGGGRLSIHSRLDRWLAWAGRQVERGGAEATTVSGLVATLAGEERLPLAGSVLRAA
jgi:hypothetical protein